MDGRVDLSRAMLHTRSTGGGQQGDLAAALLQEMRTVYLQRRTWYTVRLALDIERYRRLLFNVGVMASES